MNESLERLLGGGRLGGQQQGGLPQAGWSQSAAASGLGDQWSDFSDKAEREFPGKRENSYLGDKA